jgi:hypothetical protein
MPKTFPIMQESRRGERGAMMQIPPIEIPWEAARMAYAAYTKRYGHDQSLERLAQRGGFGRDEFLKLLSLAADDEKVIDRMRDPAP